MSEIRIAQFFRLVTANGNLHRFQNYFVSESRTYLGEAYDFAPFQAEGSMASLNGENQQLRILFPNVKYGLMLVEKGEGNRLSTLQLTTVWLDANGNIITPLSDFYVGVGAAFSDTTIELRFRSAIDSVGSEFPGRTLTRELVGPLPLNADLFLR
jgi:phage-related protein